MTTNPGEWIYDPELQREVTTVPANDIGICQSGQVLCLFVASEAYKLCDEHECYPLLQNHVIWVDRTTWAVAQLTRGATT